MARKPKVKDTAAWNKLVDRMVEMDKQGSYSGAAPTTKKTRATPRRRPAS